MGSSTKPGRSRSSSQGRHLEALRETGDAGDVSCMRRLPSLLEYGGERTGDAGPTSRSLSASLSTQPLIADDGARRRGEGEGEGEGEREGEGEGEW